MDNQYNPWNAHSPPYGDRSISDAMDPNSQQGLGQYEVSGTHGYASGFQDHSIQTARYDIAYQQAVRDPAQHHREQWHIPQAEQNSWHNHLASDGGLASPEDWIPRSPQPPQSYTQPEMEMDHEQDRYVGSVYSGEESTAPGPVSDTIPDRVEYGAPFPHESSQHTGDYSSLPDSDLSILMEFVVKESNGSPWSVLNTTQDRRSVTEQAQMPKSLWGTEISHDSALSDINNGAPSTMSIVPSSTSASSLCQNMESSMATIVPPASQGSLEPNNHNRLAGEPQQILESYSQGNSDFGMLPQGRSLEQYGSDQKQPQNAQHLSPNNARSPSVRRLSSSVTGSPRPTTSTTSGVIYCKDCDCEFTGKYRQGTLNRHVRQKHSGHALTYPCESVGCNKTYTRSDYRRNHYKRYHPELLEASSRQQDRDVAHTGPGVLSAPSHSWSQLQG